MKNTSFNLNPKVFLILSILSTLITMGLNLSAQEIRETVLAKKPGIKMTSFAFGGTGISISNVNN